MGLLSKPTQGKRATEYAAMEADAEVPATPTVSGLNPTRSDKNRQQAHPARDYRITQSGAGKKQSEGPHLQGRLTTTKENTKWKERKKRPGRTRGQRLIQRNQ
jgi:hypothetical protein